MLTCSSEHPLLVRCSNCQTPFSLEDRRVGPEGAAVRCSVCGYVFRLENETPSPWQIETVDGELFSAPDLATLRAWIAEGRLHPDDRVSRTGKQWLRLGAMPEFSDVFAGFPDLPLVFRTFEPTPLPSLPDLGPPPDFDHSGEGADFLPAVLEPSTEISLSDAGSAELGFLAGGEDSSNHVELAGLLLPADLTSAPLSLDDEEDPPIEAPLRVAQERVNQPARAAESVRVPFEHDRIDAPRPRSGSVPDASGTFFSSSELAGMGGAASPEPVARRGGWRWVIGMAAAGGLVALALGPWREHWDPPEPSTTPKGASVSPQPVADPLPPEVEAARRAVHRADRLSQVESALEARLEDEALRPRAVAALKLAQVELYSTRALLARIAAAIDRDAAQTWQFRGDDDAERAGQIFAGTDVALLGDGDVERARTRLRLVQGRPLRELTAPSGDPELDMLVRAAPLWREPERNLPNDELAALLTGLQGLAQPSAVARLLLALGHARSGNTSAARELVDSILSESPEQASALALRTRLTAAERSQPEAPPAATPSTPKAAKVAEAAPAKRSAEAPRPRATGSIDRLIDEGCNAVDAGRASEAIPLLTKAFDGRPQDLDILTCLGSAHLQLGNATTANRYFQLALDRSPQLVPALRGAARVAKRTDRKDRARELYGRLLAVVPGDREAKAYLAETAPAPGASPTGTEP